VPAHAPDERYPFFLGLDRAHTRLRSSRVLVWPVPYEATVSYGGGTCEGPAAILAASQEVELYDPRAGCEPATRFGAHTLPAAEFDASGPERAMDALTREARRLVRTGKLLCTLGGEHTVSLAPITAFAARHRNLLVVQIDAHADLRNTWDGTPYSHACVMRRALERLGGARLPDGRPRLVQVGLRNVSAEGARFAKRHRIPAFHKDGDFSLADALSVIREAAAGRPVYLTLDLDGLDPAIMPATGTPEPDGLSWGEALAVAEAITTSGRLIGFDLVELAPIPGLHAPDFLAAKLAYRIMILALGRRASRRRAR